MKTNHKDSGETSAHRNWPFTPGLLLALVLVAWMFSDCATAQTSPKATDSDWPNAETVVSEDLLGLRRIIGDVTVESPAWISERSLTEGEWGRRVPSWSRPLGSSEGKTASGCYRFDLNASEIIPSSPLTPWLDEITFYPDIAIGRILAIRRGVRINNLALQE